MNFLRKGQLEIGITMMVLLVFFVLLIIALIVYFQFSYSVIKENRQEILDNKFSTLVNALTGIPEMKCSVRGVERECLDVKKLLAFEKILDSGDREDYLDEYGILGLEVEVAYPVATNPSSCDVSTLINCNKFDLISYGGEGLKYTTPVSLYYPTDNIHKIGKLIIIAEIE